MRNTTPVLRIHLHAIDVLVEGSCHPPQRYPPSPSNFAPPPGRARPVLQMQLAKMEESGVFRLVVANTRKAVPPARLGSISEKGMKVSLITGGVQRLRDIKLVVQFRPSELLETEISVETYGFTVCSSPACAFVGPAEWYRALHTLICG